MGDSNTNFEIVNDKGSFVEMKSEPNVLSIANQLTTSSSNDIINGTSTPKTVKYEPDSDTIDEVPIDGMEFECVSVPKIEFNSLKCLKYTL